MSKKVIRYSFIFEPENTWRTLEEFNASLGSYFKSMGLNPELVEGLPSQQDEFLVLLTPTQNIVERTEETGPVSKNKLPDVISSLDD